MPEQPGALGLPHDVLGPPHGLEPIDGLELDALGLIDVPEPLDEAPSARRLPHAGCS